MTHASRLVDTYTKRILYSYLRQTGNINLLATVRNSSSELHLPTAGSCLPTTCPAQHRNDFASGHCASERGYLKIVLPSTPTARWPAK